MTKLKEESEMKNPVRQTDAIKYVAEMLADQCQIHLEDTNFTEEEIQNMYYDHLLAEIRKGG